MGVVEPGGGQAPRRFAETGLNITGFAEADDGELLLLDWGGSVQRLVPNPDAGAMPSSLKATGCVDERDAHRAGVGLIPYDGTTALWSDGSDKERWLAIPEYAHIHVRDDGRWELPPGSVLMKTFRVDGRAVETRLLVRHGAGAWSGYSYEWNAEQTDATLLDGGKVERVGAIDWTFPSGAQCFSCHTSASLRVLGVERAQLDRDFTYPNGETVNQLVVLERMGLFDRPLGVPASTELEAQAGDEGAASEAESSILLASSTSTLARAYLHANCARYRQPLGPGGGSSISAGISLNAPNVRACRQHRNAGRRGRSLLAPGILRAPPLDPVTCADRTRYRRWRAAVDPTRMR